MLVVIAIIGIMMFIGLPSFEKLLTGSGVELTARNMTSKLGMTRNYAISNRKYVALLMPTSGLPDQYCYGATRMCIVKSAGTYDSGSLVTKYTFQQWVQGESWDFLNVGSSIVHLDNTPGFSATYAAHEEVDGVKCTDIGPSCASVDNMKAIIFKPAGKIACDTSAYDNRFVTLGEAVFSSGILVRKNTSNEVNIKIEKYTGRISYGID